MTQRERIMARLQMMPDEGLHEVETCLDFIEFKYAAMKSPSLLPSHEIRGLNGDQIPEALAMRWDVLRRVQAGFKRIRGDRANTQTLYEVYQRSRPPLALNRSQFHEILVEWSSPLVGCLGREEGVTTDADQFWLAAAPISVPGS